MFATQLEQLLALLDLERIEENLFRGVSPRNGRDRIFGGQVLGQALVAAGRTAPREREAHSLHAYFLRPGEPAIPVLYEVDQIRDGRSFTTRRVRAIQRGEAIFNLSVSYQEPEDGFEHQAFHEEPGEPEGEVYEDIIRAEIARHGLVIEADDRRFDLPIEVRTLDGLHLAGADVEKPFNRHWIRARGRLADDLRLHQCVLAYASDLTLLIAAVKPHPIGMTTPGFRTASLDHAMWFHRPFRADEWLLYEQESPVAARSRGFTRGSFYTRNGVLVASCAQEGLMRYRPPVRPPE
ncbi:MAG TPA: acyl-CoA thioesterase II [Myxococcota bacterium]|nr:acyl-CoA thioesterase II [Myxococcota bacterium]